jgi:hypothetical protein
MEPEKSLLREFVNGGWLIPLIGAGGMLARLISSETQFSMMQQLRKILTAALCSTIAWFLLEHTEMSSLYKAMAYGIIGVISPEVIAGIISVGKNFEKNAHKYFFK